MASLINLPPYPPQLTAAPGNWLSGLKFKELSEQYGLFMVLAGRFQENICFINVPTEIVNFGNCGSCLVLIDTKDLLTYGSFTNFTNDISIDVREIILAQEKVLVCAPPLDGTTAFILAKIVWNEVYILDMTMAKMELLSITMGWSPNRAKPSLLEFLNYLESEESKWINSSNTITLVPPTFIKVYEEPKLRAFDNSLANSIIEHLNSPSEFKYSYFSEINHQLLQGLCMIASLAENHKDSDTKRLIYSKLLAHPSTILSIRFPETFESKIDGLETWTLSQK